VANAISHGLDDRFTPFTLGVLRGGWGWTLLILVWAKAAFVPAGSRGGSSQ